MKRPWVTRLWSPSTACKSSHKSFARNIGRRNYSCFKWNQAQLGSFSHSWACNNRIVVAINFRGVDDNTIDFIHENRNHCVYRPSSKGVFFSTSSRSPFDVASTTVASEEEAHTLNNLEFTSSGNEKQQRTITDQTTDTSPLPRIKNTIRPEVPLPPPLSLSYPQFPAANDALQRAMILEEDAIWDQVVVGTEKDMSIVTRSFDSEDLNSPHEIGKDDLRQTTPTTPKETKDDSNKHYFKSPKRNVFHLEPGNNWEFVRKFQTKNSQHLICAETGSWEIEDWLHADELVCNAWKEISVRGVILQMALLGRIHDEKRFIEHRKQQLLLQERDGTEEISSGFGKNDISSELDDITSRLDNIRKWFDYKLHQKSLRMWRLAYIGGLKDELDGCNMTPQEMFDRVVHVFHGERGMLISSDTIRIVLAAELYHQEDKKPLGRIASVTLDYSDILFKRGLDSCRPTVQLINALNSSWLKADQGKDTIEAVTKNLDILRDQNIAYDKLTYDHAVQVQIRKCSKQAAIEAESILQQQYTAFLNGNESVRPSPIMFASVVKAWAASGSPDAGERGEQILNHMLLLRQDGNVHPNTILDVLVLNNVLHCYEVSRSRESAIKAEELWRSSGIRASAVTFGTLLKLYSQANDIKSSERLVEEMEVAAVTPVYVDSFQLRNFHPDNFTYTSLFAAYARSSAQGNLEKADALMERIKTRGIIKLTTPVYNAYLSVIANQKYRARSNKAYDVVQEMEELGKTDPNVQPNKITYNALVTGWARSGASDRAVSYLDKLVAQDKTKVDLALFNVVLSSFSKSKKGCIVEQAEALMKRMKSYNDAGVMDLEPDLYTYNSLLSCYANARRPIRRKSAEQAQTILDRLRRNCTKSEQRHLQPNATTYNCVINAWAKVPDPVRADAVFTMMLADFEEGNIHAEPQTITFNLRIKAWAFSKAENATKEADNILQQMHGLASSGTLPHVAPNVKSYTQVLLCYGISNRPGDMQRAENIVVHMDNLHKAGHLDQGPNEHTFETLRRGWLTSRCEPNRLAKIAAIDRETCKRFGEPEARRIAERSQPPRAPTHRNNSREY